MGGRSNLCATDDSGVGGILGNVGVRLRVAADELEVLRDVGREAEFETFGAVFADLGFVGVGADGVGGVERLASVDVLGVKNGRLPAVATVAEIKFQAVVETLGDDRIEGRERAVDVGRSVAIWRNDSE
jgi:hypothetical protein